MRQTMLLVGCKNPEEVAKAGDLDCDIESATGFYTLRTCLRRARFIFPCHVPEEARKPLLISIFSRLESVGAEPRSTEWSFVGTTADVLTALGTAIERKVDRKLEGDTNE